MLPSKISCNQSQEIIVIVPHTISIINRNTAKERNQAVNEKDSAISHLRYQFESLTDQIKVYHMIVCVCVCVCAHACVCVYVSIFPDCSWYY